MKLSEVFTSVQGEGPNTGSPITFVRFGGCNLRCPGWGEGLLPDGTSVPGCDTVYAVYPEFRQEWRKLTPAEVVNHIPKHPAHVCLTGGEPLIQPNRELSALVGELLLEDFRIDLFTNGSIYIDPGEYAWAYNHNVTIVMDYKLPGSGEGGSFDMRNWTALGPKDALKFVCKDEDDFNFAMTALNYAPAELTAQVWFGVVWDSGLTSQALAELIQWNYTQGHLNVQMHKLIGVE